MVELSLMVQRRFILVLGAALTIFMCLIFSNLNIAIKFLQKITSEYQSWDTIHISKRKGTLWSKHFAKDNNSWTFKNGHALKAELLENTTVPNSSYCNQRRLLVYKCDTSMLCGGWADRQQGIVSTFLMALLTNRVFVIDMDKPCKLDNILLPNIYNWSLCYSFVKTVSQNNLIHYNYIDNLGKIRETLKSFDLNREWSKQVVTVRVNIYAIDEVRKHKLALIRLKWLLNISNEKAIHLALHTLFKPGEKILNDASEFYDRQIKGKQLICSHIRMGRNPSIPSDSIRDAPNETMLVQFLKSFDEEMTNAIYVASDSEEFKQLARKEIKSYITINRTIVHVDRLGKFKNIKLEACKGLVTAVLEQFIMSLCDTLILTRSGFGTMAAYMRGLDDNLFIFHPKTRIIVKSSLVNVQRVFKLH